MCLDGFQFQFLHHRLQPQGIQLLFPALGHIMVNEIDQVPDKEVHKKIEDPAGDQQYFITQKFMLPFIQQVEMLQHLHVNQRTDNGKQEGDQQEVQKLQFQFFLKQVHIQDQRTHQVAQYDTQNDEYPQPAKYLGQLIPGIELIKGVGKENADQGKPAPAHCLK